MNAGCKKGQRLIPLEAICRTEGDSGLDDVIVESAWGIRPGGRAVCYRVDPDIFVSS